MTVSFVYHHVCDSRNRVNKELSFRTITKYVESSVCNTLVRLFDTLSIQQKTYKRTIFSAKTKCTIAKDSHPQILSMIVFSLQSLSLICIDTVSLNPRKLYFFQNRTSTLEVIGAILSFHLSKHQNVCFATSKQCGLKYHLCVRY